MSKAQYDIYRRKVLDLTRTLVVKSSASADAINRELRALGHTVNENDLLSWKYYLHLAGEYHWTDVDMTVKSLDTLEDIPFTKESLEHHLATTREYRQFGSYYRALVSRYPDQEDLIKGILNPVDIQTAIDAEDGQILYYDDTLVESNEENLIPKLESWCKIFSRRWLVRAYAMVDDLYVPAHLATMYMLIPAVVMNIRLGNCHTNYAHSYHIREYLASHQKLDWAVDYMTKKQMLWLYREIRFIERNAGKQSTFKALIQNIMTERNLPLAEWSMNHSLEEMPDELTPRVEFNRSTLNLDLSAAGVESRNVVQMLEAQEGVAKGNSRILEDIAPVIREQMAYSLNDQLKTKVLESAVIDTTDAAIFSLADTLLNHWLYLAHVGRYSAVLSVDNPRTGAPLVLSVKEAFIVYMYVFGKAMGLEMTHLPVLSATHVRRLVTPTRAKLEGMVDKKLRNKHVFDAIYRNIQPVRNYISTEAFYRDVHKIHQNLLAHRWIWATREHKEERGMIEGAAMHLYHTPHCDFGSNQTFTEWFAERGLDIQLFTRLEASLLADLLVSHATGANLNATTSLRDIQTAMLRIMSTLSSYSVQFLQSINSQPLLVTDWPMPRIGRIHATAGDHIEGVSINIGVNDVRDKGGLRVRLPGVGWEEHSPLTTQGRNYDRIEFNLEVVPSGMTRQTYRIELPNFKVVHEDYPFAELVDVIDTSTDSYHPIVGVDLGTAFDFLTSPHYALDADALQTLKDRWDARPAYPPIDLYLKGLKYPRLLPENIYLDVFEVPTVNVDIIHDEIDYPVGDTTATIIHDEIEYPDGDTTVDVIHDQIKYPTSDVVLDELTYPKTVITVDGLTYPNKVVVMDAFDYPIEEVTLPALDYPEDGSET